MKGEKLSDALLAHCNWEVFHTQWEIILDNEFIDTWKNGILVSFGMIIWQFYPRIVTYSADYVEK